MIIIQNKLKIRILSFLLCFAIVISEVSGFGFVINAKAAESTSGNAVSGNTVSNNTVSNNTVSNNTVSNNTVSNNTVSNNTVSDNGINKDKEDDDLGVEDKIDTPDFDVRIYNITISQNAVRNGNVFVLNESNEHIDKAKEGTKVRIVTIPSEGYKLESVNAIDAAGNIIHLEDNCFNMPCEDVFVNIIFSEKTYNISVVENEDGMVFADKENAKAGEIVSLDVYPKNGFFCSNLYIKTADGMNIPVMNHSFVMPAKDVVIVGVFSNIPVFHSITVSENANEHGNVLTVHQSLSGNFINVYVVPDPGYSVDFVQVSYADHTVDVKEMDNGIYGFVMPDSSVVLDVCYKLNIYDISLHDDGFGSVSVNKIRASVSDKISLEIQANEGYEFDSLHVKDATGRELAVDDNIFTMPAENVNVSVSFKKKKYNIAVKASEYGVIKVVDNARAWGEDIKIEIYPNEGCRLDYLAIYDADNNRIPMVNGEFTMPKSDVQIIPVFSRVSYKVLIRQCENGQIVLNKNIATKGDLVKIDVIPDEGYELEYLSADDIFSNKLKIVDQSFTMPASDVKISADFKKKQYKITIDEIKYGKITTNKNNSVWGESVSVIASPDDDYKLDEIVIKDDKNNIIKLENGQFIMPKADITISATFSKVQYAINVETDGHGEIAIKQKTAAAGERVQFSVEPNVGYKLLKLVVTDEAGKDIAVYHNAFKMPRSNVYIKATFEEVQAIKPKYDIVIMECEHGKVETDKAEAEKGQIITLFVTPDDGYELDRIILKTESGQVEIDGNQFFMPGCQVNIIALFKKIIVPESHRVIVDEQIKNGKVIVHPLLAIRGQQIVVVTLPDEGYIFKALRVTDARGNVIEVKDDQFVMPDMDVMITATFEKYIPEYIISVDNNIENGKIVVSVERSVQGEKVSIKALANDGYRLDSLIVKDDKNGNIAIENGVFEMPASNVFVSATFVADIMETAAKGKVDVAEIVEEALEGTDKEGISVDRYISSDKKIATVNNKGIVTGKKSGTVTITAQHRLSKGHYEDLYSVEMVIKVPKLNKKVLISHPGEFNISKFLEDVPYGQNIEWKINDKTGKVATINSSTGIMNPVKNGKVKVTCIIGSGQSKVVLSSTVTIKMAYINLKDNYVMRKGTYKNVVLKSVPDESEIIWDSTDRAILQISAMSAANKVRIKAAGSGSAELIAKVDGHEYRVKVNVK